MKGWVEKKNALDSRCCDVQEEGEEKRLIVEMGD